MRVWFWDIFREVAGTLLAFLAGRRKWFIIGLGTTSALSFLAGLWLTDNYWTPLCLKVAVGCGFFTALQLLPDLKASLALRVLLAVAAIGLLVDAKFHEHRRELGIELGSTIVLFLALEFYFQHKLEELSAQEKKAVRGWARDVVFELVVELPALLDRHELPSQPTKFESASQPAGSRPFHVGDAAAATDSTHSQGPPKPEPIGPFFGVSVPPSYPWFPFAVTPAPPLEASKTVGQQLSGVVAQHIRQLTLQPSNGLSETVTHILNQPPTQVDRVTAKESSEPKQGQSPPPPQQ